MLRAALFTLLVVSILDGFLQAQRATADTPVVAVNTKTQTTDSERAFYILKFFSDVPCAEHHVWNPETWSFVAAREQLLCRLLPLAA
jgi:hypothetical protein